MCRAILYSRVSVASEITDSCSIEMQQSKLRQHADLHDITVVAELCDDGVSARDLNRPAIQQALQMLRDGDANCLIIYKLDRLTRNVDDIRALIDEFFRSDTHSLVSICDSLDTRSPMGRAIINIISVFSELERETIGSRTRDCLQQRKMTNQTYCKRLYGYNNVDGKLIPDAGEQSVIQRIFDYIDTCCYSFNHAAFLLNESAVPAPSGKRWYHHSISAIYEREKQKS